MTVDEIKELKLNNELPVEISDPYLIGVFIVINGYVPLKVERINNSYESISNIPLTFGGIPQGDLIFVREKGEIEISQMTEPEFIFFLNLATPSDYNQQNFKFNSDFVFIKHDFIVEYDTKFRNTSMLWGGFAHELNSAVPSTRHKKTLTSIEIGNELKELGDYSYESCLRAIEQPYAFERFLKLYHLLELEFDYFIIEQIKNLSIPADSNKIGKILNDYSINEINRLVELLSHTCTDIDKLEEKLQAVTSFQTIAEDMFFNFGKPGVITQITKFRNIISLGSFDKVTLKSLKISGYDEQEHPKFIIKLAANWIYKIRCSIAHNKIGEYLLSWNNEDFIVEFGEPLLKEVLIQFFKK